MDGEAVSPCRRDARSSEVEAFSGRLSPLPKSRAKPRDQRRTGEINTDAPAWHSKRRFVTRAVPDVENLDAEGLLADVVENALRTKDDLPQCSARAAGIGGADEWKRR